MTSKRHFPRILAVLRPFTGGRARRILFFGAWLAAVLAASVASAGQWPTYNHDSARSGVTEDPLQPPLVECWVFASRHAPSAAWGDPKPEPVEGYLEGRRMHFDDVFHAVSDGEAVYFGSSSDHKVSCLDAATGRVRWTRITGGPVRLAPTLAGGRVYVGSDDGHAYCLDARDGSIVWKLRAAPEDQRVLGHGKMISLWPLRTGVLVDQGVAYFAAGIFPAEGVFLYAVDANSGREIWRNDTCGESPQSRISPQGYLLASESSLYVPMGRVSPAAFDRHDGRLQYYAFFGKAVGGTYALLADKQIYTGTGEMIGYDRESRDRFATFEGQRIVVAGATAYVATETVLSALDREAFPAASRRLYDLRARHVESKQALAKARAGRDASETARKEYERLAERDAQIEAELEEAERQFAAAVRWKLPSTCHESLILAGGVLAAGGDGQVIAVAADSGEELWSARLNGVAKGLAAAEGRLLVSTDSGKIYCFGPKGAPQHGAVAEPIDPAPFADSPRTALFEQAAETILAETGVRRGFCLVLGCETGQLALELARRSELTIYAVGEDAEKVAAARRVIDSAGLQGARVSVEHWPLGRIPYADYFANLVVSETAMLGGELPEASEVARLLKPCGGSVLLGQPQGAAGGGKALDSARLRSWFVKLALALGDAEMIQTSGNWTKFVRGPLPGAGDWTHQYANPGNTACGDDQRVQCPLGVLWFGDPGPGTMVNRHRRAAAPLASGGRLFIQGENVLMAYDVYNGVKLWERGIPGAKRENASHDGSNLAVSPEGLFVVLGAECLRLDPATGRTEQTYRVPPGPEGRPSRWGYVATADGVLFGSRGTAPVASQTLFALDVASGRILWQYEGKRISHNSIAIGDGRMFLIDTDEQAAIALDSRSGQTRWKEPLDLANSGGSSVAAMYSDGVLVVFGVYLDGHYWQQFFAGEFDSRRVVALSADDGRVLWSKAVGYRVRPLIIGDTLHTEPWAFDLHTGEPRTRLHPVTGQTGPWQFARSGHHCGCPSASPNCLFFRSYCLGYYDLVNDSGTMHFGAQRPGCWINFIPAGGLLLMPEASVGCMCPFPNMCTVVFRPTDKTKGFTEYSAVGEVTPVRRLAINLGAAGDRADAAGNLWFGYPRPFQGRLVLDFKIDAGFYPGGGFVERNSTYTPVAGTEEPWLFASAARGLGKCVVPLRGAVDGSALYTVRLALADPDNDAAGRRVFDVKLQGRTVLEGLDVAADTGGRDRALVKQFAGVAVDQQLVIELVAKSPKPAVEEAPILQAIEVVQEKVVSLGCKVPDFLLSELSPKQAGALELYNPHDRPFEGAVRVAAPDGFQVGVGESALNLAGGERKSIPMEVAVSRGVAAGEYPLTVSLLRSDGTIEMERAAVIEHLGPRARIIAAAIEDATVSRRYPDMNKGSLATILVDGGSQTMGDEDHAIAYFKFALDVPGKVRSVRFQIQNAGNPSGDAGRLCLVEGPWSESKVTYNARPELGRELARLGRVRENQLVDCPLEIDLEGKGELTLAIDPTSCDGIDFLSRESADPPQLTIEYEPSRE